MSGGVRDMAFWLGGDATKGMFLHARSAAIFRSVSYNEHTDIVPIIESSSSTTEKPLGDRGDDWKCGITHDKFEGCCAN